MVEMDGERDAFLFLCFQHPGRELVDDKERAMTMKTTTIAMQHTHSESETEHIKKNKKNYKLILCVSLDL